MQSQIDFMDEHFYRLVKFAARLCSARHCVLFSLWGSQVTGMMGAGCTQLLMLVELITSYFVNYLPSD